MADIIKNGIVVNPSTGSGNTELKVKAQTPNKGNRVKQTAEFTVTAPGVSTPKKFTANHLPAAEFVKFDNGASQAVDKAGGVVTITGTSNSSKLTFSKGLGTIITKDISSVEYQANGSNTVNGVEISGDPGAQASYAFTLTINAVENETVDEKTQQITLSMFLKMVQRYLYKLLPIQHSLYLKKFISKPIQVGIPPGFYQFNKLCQKVKQT